MQLKVPFSEIPENGVELDINDSSWFPDDHMEQAGPANVHIRLTKKSDNRIELQGKLQAGVVLECDRCLARFEFQIDSPLQMILELSERDEHWRLQDLELAAGELEIVSLEKPIVDLLDILRQQLFLSLPEKKVCFENCLGLCPGCGKNLNRGDCSCARQKVSSPFAILNKLKKTR